MNTSKLSPLLLLLGLLIFMSMFSFPVQAQTAQPRDEQPNSQFGKPPTKTKKVRSTPRKTATPRPANTATVRPANTSQNTAVSASSTSASQPTQMDTTGTPASTSDVPATSAIYSATPTPQGMNTIVAQQTKTAGASFLTSTSLALTFSPTPTNFGAPTATLTFTPNASELTATALALTTTPFVQSSPTIATYSPTPTLAAFSVNRPEIPVTAEGPKLYTWVAAIIGGTILLALLYLLYKEWRRSSTRGW